MELQSNVPRLRLVRLGCASCAFCIPCASGPLIALCLAPCA
ncbi:hypothetical protein KSS87_015220 [Heliosperma pusillum]|nr:hypothetical protein KSS87_015220 [Heliosperma pusillum]